MSKNNACKYRVHFSEVHFCSFHIVLLLYGWQCWLTLTNPIEVQLRHAARIKHEQALLVLTSKRFSLARQRRRCQFVEKASFAPKKDKKDKL